MSPSRWMVGVAVLSLGCPELTPCEEADRVDEPSLEIGLGEEQFDGPIADGDVLTPSFGGQGGQHLWLAVRTSGLVPGQGRGLLLKDKDVPTFHAELIGADDDVVYADQWWEFLAMEGEPADAEIALGEFVVTSLPAVAVAQPLILRVSGADVCDHEVTSEVVITLDMETYTSSY